MDSQTKNAIREHSESHYRELDQTHGIEHLERTLELAKYLAEKEGADPDITELGAMLHQIHDSEEVRVFLEKLELEDKLIDAVVHCVYCSDMDNIDEVETLEAKVVYDADKLQVVGPFGVIREMACDTGARGKSFREALEHTREIEEKCFETLQTDTGRKIGREHHEQLETFWEKLDEMDRAEFN